MTSIVELAGRRANAFLEGAWQPSAPPLVHVAIEEARILDDSRRRGGTASNDRRMLTVWLSDEAISGLRTASRHFGVSTTAIVEQLAHVYVGTDESETDPDVLDAIVEAKAFDAQRRRRTRLKQA